MNQIEAFYSNLVSLNRHLDWRMFYGDVEVSGTYNEVYDEYGNFDFDIKIENQEDFSDEQIDEIFEFVKSNINKK